MRVMASLGLCVTPTPELYVANEKTVALTQPIGRDGIPCMYVMWLGGLRLFAPLLTDPCLDMILPFQP